MSATAAETSVAQDDPKIPPFATSGVGVIAALSAVGLCVFLSRYGYFGDELYFISAGRRLSYGYADQGPLLPLIAHAMDTVAPGSLAALRIPAVLGTIAGIVISAALAREFGGERTAQLLAAGAYATSPLLLTQGGQLATNSIDIPLWVLITWLAVRWVRTRQDGLLIAASLATAIAMQVKWLIPLFWICLGIAVLVYGPRELLRRKALWIGAAIVVLVTAPSLFWQAQHGWPQLEMARVIAGENSMVGGRLTFLPIALFFAGLLGAVLVLNGLWALFRWEPLRPYRFLGLTVLLLLVAFIVAGGRAYYAGGIYPVAAAAGAVWLTHRDPRRWERVLAVPVIALSVALALSGLPWRPENKLDPAPADPTGQATTLTLYGQLGWPELAAATAHVYQTLTPAEKAKAVVITDSYWQASALDTYRGGYLPDVYSPSRGWGYFGTPPDSATTVLYVGQHADPAQRLCTNVEPIGRSEAKLGFPGVTKDVTIWKCTGPVHPWSQTWPSLVEL